MAVRVHPILTGTSLLFCPQRLIRRAGFLPAKQTARFSDVCHGRPRVRSGPGDRVRFDQAQLTLIVTSLGRPGLALGRSTRNTPFLYDACASSAFTGAGKGTTRRKLP